MEYVISEENLSKLFWEDPEGSILKDIRSRPLSTELSKERDKVINKIQSDCVQKQESISGLSIIYYIVTYELLESLRDDKL